MNAAINNIKVDENVADREQNLKKNAKAKDAKVTSKRAALGELQNRPLARVVIAKDATQKEISGNWRSIAKPRVDTHWKKGELVTSDAAAIKQISGRVLRSTTTNATAANKVTRSGSQGLLKNINENGCGLKAVTVKLVENKPQQVKFIRKDKILPIDTKLRREDSNFSRRSISKIKAALLASSNDTTGTSKTSTHSSSTTTTTNAIKISAETDNNTKVEPVKEKPSLSSPETIMTKCNKIDIEENQSSTAEVPQNIDIIAIEPTTSVDTKCEAYDVKSARSIRPSGVTDIDKEDGDWLILVSEYVNDIYDYYFMLESEQMVMSDHLSKQEAVAPKMRAVLLDWINEVHEQFHMSNETYHMSVGIIDRYLQKVQHTKRSMLQLVGVTSLLMAAKYEEVYPPSMNDFIYMTDDTYTVKQVIQMEMEIFRTLDYNLSRPVSLHFLRRFSKTASADDVLHTMSKYFLELATISYDLASCKPSEIAAASLFLSLHLAKHDLNKQTGFDDDLWDKTLQYYSRYIPSQLRPITKKIAVLARNAKTAKLGAIYSKYEKTKYYKVASRREMCSPLMDSIIKSK